MVSNLSSLLQFLRAATKLFPRVFVNYLLTNQTGLNILCTLIMNLGMTPIKQESVGRKRGKGTKI